MTHRVPPRVDTLKRCMGLFHGNYNTLSPTYVPPTSLDESAVASEGLPPGPPSSLNILTALDGSNASITGVISENRVAAMSVLLCLLVFFITSHARSPMRKLPPQPRRKPVIGNLSQMSDKKWLFSRESKEQFGEYEDLAG
jgi:hypothetical protein